MFDVHRQFAAFHLRHGMVRDYEVKGILAKSFQRFFSVRCLHHGVAIYGEQHLDKFPNILLIISQQDSFPELFREEQS